MPQSNVPPQQPELRISYVDRPEISEAFADSVEKINFDGQSWRIEFSVTRLEAPIPPNIQPAKRYPSCRLVLSINAGMALAAQLQAILSELERQGMIQKIPVTNLTPPGSTKH
jgi:hypothetical protein